MKVREGLKEIEVWSRTTKLVLNTHKRGKDNIPVISNWTDLFQEMSEKFSLLTTLQQSIFFETFMDLGDIYLSKLNRLDQILQLMNKIQRIWLYLEPVLNSGSIILRDKDFVPADREFRCLMESVRQNPYLFFLINERENASLDKTLHMIHEQMQMCQKSLYSVLEETRMIIPRFYFLSDCDLMEIMGRADDSKIVARHIHKVFQAIKSITIDSNSIVKFGTDNEDISLLERVRFTSVVTEWFPLLIDEQKKSLEHLLRMCNSEGSVIPTKKYPVQVVMLNNEIIFTKIVEEELDNHNDLQSLHKKIISQLTSLVSSIYQSSSRSENLALRFIHHRDVLDSLVNAKEVIRGVSDWAWQKHMRHYMNNGSVVRMGLAEMTYSYEYQGTSIGLVYTSLTDRCFLALTQAIHFGFGGG